ncbi:MAG TPA: DUF1549 domain-containing protein [Planctomycetia bacterium]|nr:DUF1549 domain-containing protein [Planctomycetia bacterium]
MAALVVFSFSFRRELLARQRPELPVAAPIAAAPIDARFDQFWTDKGLKPLPPADDLQVARRLSLALCGTIPAYSEIKWLESRPASTRIAEWTDRLLADPRCHDYLAERLLRATNSLGTADPFFIYRQRRYVQWLAERIAHRRPYDETVRECVSGTGVWTDKPAVNFLTGHDLDPIKLANRTARGFLGLRIDCAQCHDHPFAKWKQGDFMGLAAWYGNAKLGFRGVQDGTGPVEIENSANQKKEVVEPKAPFQPELLPAEGTPRERLAAWIVHPENKYFSRAIANRMWALLFGRGLVEPVDNLEGPEAVPGVLEMLAADFRANGHDLQRLVRMIAATRAFRLQSAMHAEVDGKAEAAFAAFPLTRLRAEQAAGAIVQSATLRPIDDRSSAIAQLMAFGSQKDFVERFGDAGEEEMIARDGNLAQRLLLLNGEVLHKQIKHDLVNACQRIAQFSPDVKSAVRNAYLATLSRSPTPKEADHFEALLGAAKGDAFEREFEDLLWSLLNSSEFAWNH